MYVSGFSSAHYRILADIRSSEMKSSTKRRESLGSSVWRSITATLAVLVMLAFTAQSFAFTAQSSQAPQSIICDCPCPGTPIIIDVSGKGFHLTNAMNGVRFDISGTDHPVQIAWTVADSDNAFLALPGSDGLVHNGKELFGDFTPQPPSDDANGFRALAVYDQPENGGNGDGIMDSRDQIFSSLRLWIDTNHDGICQPEELHTLPSMGVYSISLDYFVSRKRDRWGNLFRYGSEVNSDESQNGSEVGRITYDVILVEAAKGR
jgi:hypothetical protein